MSTMDHDDRLALTDQPRWNAIEMPTTSRGTTSEEERQNQYDLCLTLIDVPDETMPTQWRFSESKTINIGRAKANDVQLKNRHVSRLHATLTWNGRCWNCTNRGQNGTYVKGRDVSRVAIKEGTVAQLGRKGPKILFSLIPLNEPAIDDSSSVGEHQVSHWLVELKAGDPDAAEKLWEQYFERLVRLARRRLGGTPRRVADEEDVALSAFKSFCLGVSDGRFSQLHGQNSLWRLLVVITARKAINQIQNQMAQKRGGGNVRGESVFDHGNGTGSFSPGFGQVVGEQPSPEFEAIFSEETRRLLESLENDQLRTIALRKMEGFTNDEIADQLGCSSRTIRRKVEEIRSAWMGSVGDEAFNIAGALAVSTDLPHPDTNAN